MTAATFPVCFVSAAQYQNWSVLAVLNPPKPDLGYCEDCTSDHQARMGRQGKCSRPEIQFVKGVAVAGPPLAARLTPEERKREADRRYKAKVMATNREGYLAKQAAWRAAARDRELDQQEAAR